MGVFSIQFEKQLSANIKIADFVSGAISGTAKNLVPGPLDAVFSLPELMGGTADVALADKRSKEKGTGFFGRKKDIQQAQEKGLGRIGGATGGFTGGAVGAGAGSAAGTAIGATLGTAVLPVVGTVSGAAVGNVIGGLVGGGAGYNIGNKAGNKAGVGIGRSNKGRRFIG